MPKQIQDLQVYVINLDRRTDRWSKVTDELERAGFSRFSRISAVDGKQIDSKQIAHLMTPEAYSRLGKIRESHEECSSLGAIGCYLSHYKVWLEIIRTQQPAIVVEDDIEFNRPLDNYSTMQDIEPWMKYYDFVLLGWTDRNHQLLKTNQPDGIYAFRGWFFGTHFYYLSPRGAQQFLAQALPIFWQVDSYMVQQIRDQPRFRSAAHVPSLAGQDARSSDVQTPKREDRCCKVTFIFICFLVYLMVISVINLIRCNSI